MPLRIKRIYDEPDPADGERILIDRLWPRGIKKTDARIGLWLKDAAPSTPLRRWFGHDPEKFPEFRRRYLAELAERPHALDPITEPLRAGRTVTLLYASRDTTHNHARVLADHLAPGKKKG